MSLLQLLLDDMRGKIPPIEPSCGCFIAGGAIRRWFTGGEKLSDIDVFGPSKSHTDEFIKEFGLNAVQTDDTKNATTYAVAGVKLQVIKHYHPTIEALLESFDFNVCQFGWSDDGIFATQKAVIGVLRGHLSVATIHKDFAVDSLRRAFKYNAKGFTPCGGTIRDLANSLRGLTEEEVKKQVEMSPRGGKWKIVRFD